MSDIKQMRREGLFLLSSTEIMVNYPVGTTKFKFEKSQPSDHGDVLDPESFYMAFVPHKLENVSVASDCRTLEDLRSCFPAVDSTQLHKVWDNSQSWVHCFNVLSSLALSQNAVVISSEQLDVVSNSQDWPLLRKDCDFSDSFSGLTIEERGGWTLCTVDSDHDQDWELVDNPNEDGDCDDGYYDDAFYGEEEEVVVAEEDTPVSFPVTAAGTVSYRDMVLKNIDAIKLAEHKEAVRTQSKPWRPVFVLDNPIPHNCGKRSASEQETHHSSDDEDEDYWADYLGAKSAALSARLHSTHVRNALKRTHVDQVKSLRSKY